MKRSKLLLLFVLFVLSFQANAQQKLPRVLLRVDDIGMNHSVNMAIKDLAETGIPFSTSVMFTCPWYQEAVAILKNYPNVSVGVHLTLNAEWKYYRWGPILGRSTVSSLVDKDGYFFSSIREFQENKPNLNEVEQELSAQIERAINSGLKIDYVDYHMGAAVSTPELQAIVEKLAKKYQLGISKYFGEDYKTMWPVPVESKKSEFEAHLGKLKTDRVNLVEWHVAYDTPEMSVLKDLNSDLMNAGEVPMAGKHREAELKVLTSKEFKDLIGKRFDLVTYKDLVKKPGLEAMKAPKKF
jgi:chitin disaccharide deacetylase